MLLNLLVQVLRFEKQAREQIGSFSFHVVLLYFGDFLLTVGKQTPLQGYALETPQSLFTASAPHPLVTVGGGSSR